MVRRNVYEGPRRSYGYGALFTEYEEKCGLQLRCDAKLFSSHLRKAALCLTHRIICHSYNTYRTWANMYA